MNDKIIAVMRKIQSLPEHITDIYLENAEYYFKFGDHVFSIAKRSDDKYGDYSLYFYPKYTGSTDELAEQYRYGSGEDIAMLGYHEGEFDGAAKALFREIYSVIEERFLGADEAFNDILNHF